MNAFSLSMAATTDYFVIRLAICRFLSSITRRGSSTIDQKVEVVRTSQLHRVHPAADQNDAVGNARQGRRLHHAVRGEAADEAEEDLRTFPDLAVVHIRVMAVAEDLQSAAGVEAAHFDNAVRSLVHSDTAEAEPASRRDSDAQDRVNERVVLRMRLRQLVLPAGCMSPDRNRQVQSLYEAHQNQGRHCGTDCIHSVADSSQELDAVAVEYSC